MFSDPQLFGVSNHRIPCWVQSHYRSLCLITTSKGHITGGYASIASQLSISKPFAIRLVKWLLRLKLLVVVEAGKAGRGRSTTWQLRRWFMHPKPLKGNHSPIRIDVRTNGVPYGNINRVQRTSLSRRADSALKRFFDGNDLRLAKRVIHAFIWKTKPALAQIEHTLIALETTHLHRPKRLNTPSAFVGWFKWLLQRIVKHGRSWREKFMQEYDHRLDGRRIKAQMKQIDSAEAKGKPCPMCGDVWAVGDREHQCANWAFRRWEAWLEEDWQVRKYTEYRCMLVAQPETQPQQASVPTPMTQEEEAQQRAMVRALLLEDGYLSAC